jgi:8-amino-7-oxononanoate synthase
MDIAIAAGGRLLIDDTQALGLVGPCGGGSLRACDLPLGGVVVASLAKAFAAPLAFVGGARHDVASYIDESETRVHLSPPSLVDIHAADSAVRLNRRLGATRRRRLQAAINYLRYGLSANGLQPRPPMQQSTLFPVQAIPPIRGLSARYVHQRLLNAGIRGVLHTSCDGQPRVSLVLRATHTRAQLDRALAAVAGAC